MVVEKGHKIYIPNSQVTDKEVTVRWSQDWGQQKSAEYYSVPFFNKDQGDEESLIFIEKSRLDELRGKSAGGDTLTVIVDDSFQYGQNKQKTVRWLAYHNKSYKMYQWRFVEGLAAKIGQAALTFAGGVFKGVELGSLAALFGDPLRNF